MAERPTRKKGDDAPAQEQETTKQTTTRKAPAKRKVNPKLTVFHEDTETGTLTPVGEYKGDKPEDVLATYFAALEEEDREQAYAASTYAVETPRGLVRLTATRTVTIARR